MTRSNFFVLRELQPGVAVGRLLGRDAFQPEMETHQFPDVGFVFDDEHGRPGGGWLHHDGAVSRAGPQRFGHELIASELGGPPVTRM